MVWGVRAQAIGLGAGGLGFLFLGSRLGIQGRVLRSQHLKEDFFVASVCRLLLLSVFRVWGLVSSVRNPNRPNLKNTSPLHSQDS